MHFYATFLVVFSSLEHVQLACARDTTGAVLLERSRAAPAFGDGALPGPSGRQ